MAFFSTLLKLFGLRAQARDAGLSASDANKAAVIAAALEEAEKKAAAEQKKEDK